MRELRRFFFLIPVVIVVSTLAVHAQDEPSLGDVARQSRQQKQQKDVPSKPVVANSFGQNDLASGGIAQTSAVSIDAPEQNKAGETGDASSKGASVPAVKAPHVITNEDIASPFGANSDPNSEADGSHMPGAKSLKESDSGKASAEAKVPAETWTAQILAQKNAIAALQGEIKSLSDSIQFAPANCVSGCVDWNEHQKQKQDQVESMKTQLDQLQQKLSEMQEAARQQGYGSSVYEP